MDGTDDRLTVVAPLIQFAIFASQSAVLEVWFPSWFGIRPDSGPPPMTSATSANVAVTRSDGVGAVYGNRTRVEAPGVESTEYGSETVSTVDLSTVASWSVNDDARSLHTVQEIAIDEGGMEETEPNGEDEDDYTNEAGPSTPSRKGMGIFSCVFDSDIGHLPESCLHGSEEGLEEGNFNLPRGMHSDEESERDPVATGSTSFGHSRTTSFDSRPDSEVDEQSRVYRHTRKREFSLKNGKGKERADESFHASGDASCNVDPHTSWTTDTMADSEEIDSSRAIPPNTSLSPSGKDTPSRTSTRTRRRDRVRVDPPIPNFLKKGPVRLPER